MTRYQKDVCPICGERNPFDSTEHYTTDLTQVVQTIKKEQLAGEYKYCSKKKYSFLAILIGISAAHLFYIQKRNSAVIWLSMNLLAIGVVGALLFFLMDKNGFGFLISFGAAYLLNIIFGFVTFFLKDLKDGNGEFLK